jgi:hypothetical protein
MLPSQLKTSVSSDTPIMTGASQRINWLETTNGTKSAEIPSMNNPLKILLPTTFPTDLQVIQAAILSFMSACAPPVALMPRPVNASRGGTR